MLPRVKPVIWLNIVLFSLLSRLWYTLTTILVARLHMHDLAIGGVYVSLSVRLLHAGTDSKLMTVGSCGFHRRVAQEH